MQESTNPHGLAINLYSATRKGYSTNLCQGIPDWIAIDSLLSKLGWGSRSRRIRAGLIRQFMLIYHALDNEGNSAGELSMRLLASSLGQSSTSSGQSFINEFMKVVYEVKLTELERGITSAYERLAQGHTHALMNIYSLQKVCGPAANPTMIALALPYIRVIGLATQQLQRTMGVLQDESREFIHKEILQCGNQVIFPDPDRIKSERSSRVINRRTGTTLHKIFRAYEVSLKV